MAVSRSAWWTNVANSSLAALVLAITGFAADRAGAEIIKKEDTLRGITTTREQCAAKPQTVWLTVYRQDFCVRYYLSNSGGQGSRPVVILNGDYNGPLDLHRRSWIDPSKAQDIDTAQLAAMADMFSKMAKTTAIYLGRIGVEGTSGNHMSRKTLLELHLMNMALEAIKQRHGFEGFHLVGQSAGGRLIVGLAALRRDVGCLVSGSGQLTTSMGNPNSGDPDKTYFDIAGSVPRLAQSHALRMMVVTDPADLQVPSAQQSPMVAKLRQAGGTVAQFFVEAIDPRHHGVLEYSRLAVAGCVLGRSDADIAQAMGTITRRAAEINRRQQDEARTKTALGTTPRQGRS